jgi:hypothetical protein
MSFFGIISRFASIGGFTYATQKYLRLFTVCLNLNMVSYNMNYLEILISRKGGFSRFHEKLDCYQKCPQYILP